MARLLASWNHAKGLATPAAKRSRMREALLDGLKAPVFAVVIGSAIIIHYGLPRTEAFITNLVSQHPAPLIHSSVAPSP